MKILSRDTLPLGGFAGLTEHQLVTDSRVFGPHKKPGASEGLGRFVYLADARFNPKGETRMHPHREVDVISIMIEGRINHEGSLEHGSSVEAGQVQVQRAGGEGFSHNEINPDTTKNRMIQLWALPETPGQAADYKAYTPSKDAITRIYGGPTDQSKTFDSHTIIDIVNIPAGKSIQLKEAQYLSYITQGIASFKEGGEVQPAKDGDLIHSQGIEVQAETDTSMIVIYKVDEH